MTLRYANPADDIMAQDEELDAVAHVVTDAQARAMSAAAYTVARSELNKVRYLSPSDVDTLAREIAQSQCVALAQVIYFTTRRALYAQRYPERFKEPIALAVLTIEEEPQ